MLLELKVSNFAIIENAHLKFGPGFNILSGDTGAGKSILIKSLSLVMGHKGSIESIRTGETQASIEGVFDISKREDIQRKLLDQGIEVEENLLLVRRILSDEKSRVYLNGVLSPLNLLRDLVSPLIEMTGATAPLIEMTGQFDNRNLMSKSYHLDSLDQFAKNGNLRKQFEELYGKYKASLSELEQLEMNSRDFEQRLDFLKYQRDEIHGLGMKPGDEEALEARIKMIRSSEKLVRFAADVDELLLESDSSSIAQLKVVLNRAQDLRTVDPELTVLTEPLRQALALIEDTHFEIQRHFKKIDTDQDSLDELESKLSQLRKLQKKFGASLDEIYDQLGKIEKEIMSLENLEFSRAQIKSTIQAHLSELDKLANSLHQTRQASSEKLAKLVNAELEDLNMKGLRFHVDISKTDDLGLTGFSQVEFQVATGKNEPRRPLAKSASGGEISRILLALKKSLGAGKHPRTFLFDEVDTGVSGPTAEKVGRKLKEISNNQQVICVTHLAQVAAFADTHFHISKSSGQKNMTMDVRNLVKTERTSEIARLISGEKVTKTSMAHAQELIKQAKH